MYTLDFGVLFVSVVYTTLHLVVCAFDGTLFI